MIKLLLVFLPHLIRADGDIPLYQGQSVVACNTSTVGSTKRAIEDLNYILLGEEIYLQNFNMRIVKPYRVSTLSITPATSTDGALACVVVTKE